MIGQPVYVLDTHAFVRLLKGDPTLPAKAKQLMTNSKSQLVVPLHVIDEIALKFNDWACKGKNHNAIKCPPAPCLRLAIVAKNIKVFPRSPAVRAEEMNLQRAKKRNGLKISEQDIPICAAAIAIANGATDIGKVFIISADDQIKKCGLVPVLWK